MYSHHLSLIFLLLHFFFNHDVKGGRAFEPVSCLPPTISIANITNVNITLCLLITINSPD